MNKLVIFILIAANLSGTLSLLKLSNGSDKREFTSEEDINNLFFCEGIFNNSTNEEKLTPKVFNDHIEPAQFSLKEFLDIVEEPYFWRYNYIEEQQDDGNQVLVKEDSIDERLSNIGFTVHSSKLFHHDIYKIDTGNKLRDRELEDLAADSKVDQELCGRHLAEIDSLLRETSSVVSKRRLDSNGSNATINDKHIRLAFFLDSFARYDFGLLSGKTRFLGSYNQCKRSKLILNSEEQLIGTRYCSALLPTSKHLNSRLKSRPKPNFEERNIMNVGICLPESCHTNSFRIHKDLITRLVQTQFKLPKEIYIDEKLDVESIFCEISSDSNLVKIPPAGKVFLSLIGCWILAGFIFTIWGEQIIANIERQESKLSFVNKWLPHLIESLNLSRSWNSLIKFNQEASDTKMNTINLDAINAVKVFSAFLVIMGHSFMLKTSFMSDTLYGYSDLQQDPKTAIMLNATLVTDTFFVITGILLSFLSLNKLSKFYDRRKALEKEGDNNFILKLYKFFEDCFKIIVTRYTRLIPLYVIVYYFQKYVFINMHSGPIWDTGYNEHTMMGSCRKEAWYTPFALLSPMMSLSRQCLPHTWSTADDLYFTIITAPILVLMVRRPKLALLTAVALSCWSNWAMFVQTNIIGGDFRYKYVGSIKFVVLPVMFAAGANIYSLPIYRLAPILIGVVFGYYLHLIDQKKQNPLKGRLSFATQASIGSAIFIGIAPLLIILNKDTYYDITSITGYSFDVVFTLGRALWSLSNAILLFRMIVDWQNSYLIKLSSASFFEIMSKLNYGIYLTHLTVLAYDAQTSLDIGLHSYFSTIKLTISTYILSAVIAMVLHVFLENPINILVKGFLEPHKRLGQKTAKSVDKNEKEETIVTSSLSQRALAAPIVKTASHEQGSLTRRPQNELHNTRC